MSFQHKRLQQGRWKQLSFFEQMANIGSEVERALNWREKDEKYSRMALDRALELIDLTIDDKKNVKRLKEITRVREFLIDYFLYGNNYSFTEESWRNYFYNFAYAVANRNKSGIGDDISPIGSGITLLDQGTTS